MSKKVKNIITGDLQKRLEGVEYALILDVIGLEVNSSNKLRKNLADKSIHILAVKNSLARRATTGTALDGLFPASMSGSAAICWGAQDIVALAKEIVLISKEKAYAKLKVLGGILDGDVFPANQVVEISKWPTREEQISLLLGQILGVGAKLSSQLLAGGANLASQIKQLADKDEENKEEAAA